MLHSMELCHGCQKVQNAYEPKACHDGENSIYQPSGVIAPVGGVGVAVGMAAGSAGTVERNVGASCVYRVFHGYKPPFCERHRRGYETYGLSHNFKICYNILGEFGILQNPWR